MSHYALAQIVAPKPDGLSCRFLMAPPEQTDKQRVLVVAFDGDYPDGSRGNAHGRYIATETMHGLYAFEPDAVVLDFRRLKYRWGNTLLRVFEGIPSFQSAGDDGPAFPFVVVISDSCRDGFLSLVSPTGAPPPPWCFDDIDAAITHAIKTSREWLGI